MHGIHLSTYHAITTQRTPAFLCHKESAQGTVNTPIGGIYSTLCHKEMDLGA